MPSKRTAATEPETNPFAIPSDPEKLIGWLNRKREVGRSRLPELQMKMNLAYVLGQQWIAWDQVKKQYVTPQVDPSDPNPPVRITANKIAGILERSISKLTKTSPIPEARPVSDEEDDVGTAKVATRILDSEMNRLGWEAFLTNFYFWVGTLGWSYVHVAWDPMQGKQVGTGPVEVSPGVSTDLHEGQITIEDVPAFELAVDPNARHMRDAKWLVRTTTMTREAVYEKWGKIVVDGEPGRDLSDEVHSIGQHGYNSEQTEWIFVHQFWLVPGSRLKPEGMVISWSGKTILEGPKKFPFDHGVLPFTQYDLLPGIGTREGRTWVNDLIPLQTDYNDARSREAEIRRMLVPKILAPAGSIEPDRVTSRVEVILYNPTGPEPHIEVPDSGWIAQYEAGMQRADQEMGERAGQQDVSSGRAPSASMPAAAILALQEADDTKLAISAKLLAQALQETGWQILMLARQYWREERIVRTWSDSGDLNVQRFMGSDIGAQLDVHVSTESAMPRSKSARAQLAIELWNSPKPVFNDPRVLVRMIDMPGTDSLVETLDLDAKQQQRELGQLIKGIQVEVHSWDNHMVHITEVDNFRKSGEYDKLDDAIKAVIDAHAESHNELVLQQLGVPTPPGTQQTHDGLGLSAGGPAGQNGPDASVGGTAADHLDPTTGKPPNPLDVASGNSPSALTGSTFDPQAGQVPGIPPDQQQAQMGN